MAGSRRRYLAEQAAFMAEKLDYEVQKGLPSHVLFRGKRARILEDHGGGKITVLGPNDERFITHLDRVTFLRPKGNGQMKLPFGKAATAEQRRTRMLISNDPDEIRELRAGKPMRQPRKVMGGDEIQDGINISFQRRLWRAARRQKQTGRLEIVKSQPLKTHMKEKDAKRVVGRYGMAGELPKTLTREQRMGAYEARYVASGGRKGEKWQRRAEASDKVKTVGLGVATAGGGAWLAGRTKLGSKVKVTPKRREIADNIAVGGATVGGAGELYGMRARRKRASYSSAPGGAAASALRRMRAMDAARSQR